MTASAQHKLLKAHVVLTLARELGRLPMAAELGRLLRVLSRVLAGCERLEHLVPPDLYHGIGGTSRARDVELEGSPRALGGVRPC